MMELIMQRFLHNNDIRFIPAQMRVRCNAKEMMYD